MNAAGKIALGAAAAVGAWLLWPKKPSASSTSVQSPPETRPTGYPPPPGQRSPPGFYAPAPPAEATVSVELWFVSVLYELQPDESWRIVGQEPWQSYVASTIEAAASALEHEQWVFQNQAFAVELWRRPPPWKVALLWGMGRHLREVLTGMPASPSALGVVASKGNSRP